MFIRAQFTFSDGSSPFTIEGDSYQDFIVNFMNHFHPTREVRDIPIIRHEQNATRPRNSHSPDFFESRSPLGHRSLRIQVQVTFVDGSLPFTISGDSYRTVLRHLERQINFNYER